MKKIEIYILVLGLLFSLLWSASEIFKERFTNLTYSNTKKTNGGWNIDGTYGISSRRPPRTSHSGDPAGATFRCAISDNYAYCSQQGSGAGLAIVKILDGTVEGQVASNGTDWDVAYTGGYAFLAAENYFHSVNTDPPSNPTIAHTLSGNNYYGIAIYGDSAYVGGGAGGLRRINISNPTNMVDEGNVTWAADRFGMGVAIYDTFALVCDTLNKAIAVIDIKGALASRDTTRVGSAPYYISTFDTLALVSAGDSIFILGLKTLMDGDANVKLPIRARLGSHGFARSAAVLDDKLIVADGKGWISMYQIKFSDFTKTYMLCATDSLAGGVSATDVKISELGYIVAADSERVSFLEWGQISPGDNWADTLGIGESYGMVIDRNNLFVSCGNIGVVSVDVSDPINLVAKDTFSVQSALGMDISGTKLYLCTGSNMPNFRKIDVSNISNMYQVSNTTLPGMAFCVDVSGNYAYVGTSDSVLKVDLSDYSIDARYGSNYEFLTVIVDGSYVYAANDAGGLKVLNATDLSLVGSLSTQGKTWSIAKKGNYIYSAEKEKGFRVINVETPSNPTQVALLDTSNFHGEVISVSIYGNYAVVGLLESADRDFRLVNISNPASPTVTHQCPSGTWIGQSAVGYMSYLIVSDYGHGIKSWRVRQHRSDFLDDTTKHHSNKINTISPFRYLHWSCWETFDNSSAPSDTSYFWLKYKKSSGTWDSIPIMNHDSDPPNDPLGQRTYFDLGGNCDSLMWVGLTVERDSNLTNHYPYTTSSDTTWYLDSVEIEIKDALLLLRQAAGFSTGDNNLSIVWDTSALTDIDPLDVQYFPSGGYEAYFELVINGESRYFSTISLPYNQIPPKITLHNTFPIVPSSFHELYPGMFWVDGIDITEISIIPSGSHNITVRPPYKIRLVYSFVPGWHIISFPYTSPLPVSHTNGLAGFIFKYEPSVGMFLETDTLYPGEAYFYFTITENVAFGDGLPNKFYKKLLHPGWNLIGSIDGTIPVWHLRTVPEDALLPGAFYSLPGGGNEYQPAIQIAPKEGLWVFALTQCTLFVDDSALFLKKQRDIVIRNPQHLIRLSIIANEQEHSLWLGIDPDATDGFDEGLDIMLPPPFPNSSFPAELVYNGPGNKLLRDVRSKGEWTINIKQPVELRYSYDYRYGGLRIEGKNGSLIPGFSTSLKLSPGIYKLEWNDELKLPSEFSLRCSPNPFNSTVEMLITLPSSRAELSICDLSGRLVRRYELVGNGNHKILWDARDDSGKDLPSGVYFVSLNAENSIKSTSKLLFIK